MSRSFLPVCACLCIAIVLYSCKGKGGGSVYKSKTGIEVTYPGGWKEERSYGENVFLLLLQADGPTKINFLENIKMEAVSQEGKAVDFATMVKNNRKYAVDNKLVLLEDELTKIDGKDAMRVVYNDQLGNDKMKVMQFLQIFNDHLYILTFSAREKKFDELRKEAEAIIRSTKY